MTELAGKYIVDSIVIVAYPIELTKLLSGIIVKIETNARTEL
jgi:hypothetical protein